MLQGTMYEHLTLPWDRRGRPFPSIRIVKGERQTRQYRAHFVLAVVQSQTYNFPELSLHELILGHAKIDDAIGIRLFIELVGIDLDHPLEHDVLARQVLLRPQGQVGLSGHGWSWRQ